MAFTVAQAVAASAGSAASVQTANITTAASGSLFVCFVARYGNVATSSVTDAKGNTYTCISGNSGVEPAGYAGSHVEIWISQASPTGGASHWFKATLASADFPSIVAWEVTAGLTPTVDAGGSTTFTHAGSFAASVTSPTLTTVTAADVLLAVGGNAGDANSPSQTLTAGTGGGTYTMPTGAQVTTVAGLPIKTAYQDVATTGTRSVTYTPAVSEGNSAVGILALQADSGLLVAPTGVDSEEALGSANLTQKDVQTAAPVSDVAAGAWTPSTGVDLFAMVDEPAIDDTDWIASSVNPQADLAELALGPQADPASSDGHVIQYRIRLVS